MASDARTDMRRWVWWTRWGAVAFFVFGALAAAVYVVGSDLWGLPWGAAQVGIGLHFYYRGRRDQLELMDSDDLGGKA